MTTEVGGATVITGVRLWVNQWDIGGVEFLPVVASQSPPTLVLQQTPFRTISQTTVVPIPFVAVRVGNFLGSASYFVRTNYDSRDALLGTVPRDEFDITLGYSVLPSIVLSVGYKHTFQGKLLGQPPDQPQVPSSVTGDGVLLGVSANAPLADRFSLYGNVAYGLGHAKAKFSGINIGGIEFAAQSPRFDANYLIGEVGVAYLAYQGDPGAAMKSVSVTLGYRTQSFTLKSVTFATIAFPSGELIDVQHQDVRSSTNGFVFGLVGVF